MGTYPVLVVDNGGFTVKALYVVTESEGSAMRARVAVIPNCVGAASYVGRGIVGEQLFKLPHFHGFMVRRPVDRGFIVDVGLESHIWEYVLEHFSIADESQVELIMTVPFGVPKQVGELIHYLVAQRFKFRSVTFVSSSFLTLLAFASRDWLYGGITNNCVNDKHTDGARDDSGAGAEFVSGFGCGVVVDFGFSSTTVVPYVDFFPVQDSIVRIDVGGKLLSNRLKEHISFTQINMVEDGWLVNHIMEQVCYVTINPRYSLQEAAREKRCSKGSRNAGGLRYYLPTVPSLMPLGCREEQLSQMVGKSVAPEEKNSLQHIVFRQEAFLIPELIFSPTDVGILQMGVVEAIVHGICCRGSLQNMRTLHSEMMHRIMAFGGISKFSNLFERLAVELRTHLRSEVPLTSCSSIGKNLAPVQELVKGSDIKSVCVDFDCSGAGYVPCDNEIQPLYGALALIACPLMERQRKLVQSRSQVEFISVPAAKGSQHRHQISTGPKTLTAVLSALQNLV